MPTSSERAADGCRECRRRRAVRRRLARVEPSRAPAPLAPALSLRGVGKSYNVAGRQSTTLAEQVADWVGRARTSSEANRFWALRDVTCEIGKGEIVGLVGRNGAGKSTLLKVITGVTTPSTGDIDVYGRIGSLLEVGTGFHPELTGRENVFLNGAFIGMRRAEIRQRFDEIVEFSGVEAFLDMPIKRYSSGMAVRLAFAVAAHLDADILLVDEVLAVGDQAFQDKCLGKMREVRQREGRTVLFVSHNLAAVASLCTRALLLQSGRVIADASRGGDLPDVRRRRGVDDERRGGSHERAAAEAVAGAVHGGARERHRRVGSADGRDRIRAARSRSR